MGHRGTTQKAVKLIEEKLGKENTITIDLAVQNPPLISNFKTIIIGGRIQSGMIQDKIYRFCKQHESALTTKRLGLFIDYMDKESAKKVFEESYSFKLRKHAIAHGFFSEEFPFERMNFIEKLIVKEVGGVRKNVSDIDYAAIEQFNDSFS